MSRCIAALRARGQGVEQGAGQEAIITRHTLEESLRPGSSILLVEDNLINQKVAMQMLHKQGYAVQVAENGREALDALRAGRFGLVLMDCQMPVMDGYEATRRIRAGEGGAEHAAIPIVALTANAMTGDRERCVEAGMDDYLAKPLSFGQLAMSLTRWLRRGNPSEHGGEPSVQPLDRASSETVFDDKEMLFNLGGDREMARLLVSMVLADMPGHLSALERALAELDPEEARREAHAMKGLSLQVGGKRLMGLLEEIERQSRAGASPAANAVPEVQARYQELAAAMREWLAR